MLIFIFHFFLIFSAYVLDYRNIFKLVVNTYNNAGGEFKEKRGVG